MLKKDVPNQSLLFFTCIILFSSFTVNSQWKYDSTEKIKDEINIIYEVIYERELTPEEKQSTHFISEFSIVFNNNMLIERRFPNLRSSDSYTLIDYNREKIYFCNMSSGDKIAIVQNFKEPKKIVTPQDGGEKKIVGIDCDRGMTMVNGKPKEVFYTKNLGLRYCKQFNANGFLLEYPSYSKKLGHYTVVAKSIQSFKFDSSHFSLGDHEILTSKEYKDRRKESSSKYAAIIDEKLNSNAPKYNIRSIDGEKFSRKELNGKVIVLNFWFTTCPPCKKEIPNLNKLKGKYANDENVAFIAIALDDNYKLDSFLQYYKFDYNIVANGRSVASDFDVPAYPTNIIIDKEGKIKFYEVGYKTDIVEKMSYSIDKALENN